MAGPKRTVLITGCSEEGLGAALAIALHEAGLHVYATARNPDKMKQLAAMGIETLTLDVLSETSIAKAVSQVPSLDILINNAGGGYNMPISDLSIAEAKKLFDLNVWSYISVTQAFLPLLLESKGMVVNQTSVAGLVGLPFQAAYGASKAAMGSFSESLRLELQPFGITVVDLKTGGVKSRFFANSRDKRSVTLPKNSIYQPARERVEQALDGVGLENSGIPAELWAKQVVKELLKKTPPSNIWKGDSAWLVWLSTMLPHGLFDGKLKQLVGLDVVEQQIKK
jgi:1-acylglycerone phosphate reductase